MRGAAGGHEVGRIGAVRQGRIARLEELRGEDPVVPLRGHLAGDVGVRGDDRVDAVAAELGGLFAGQVGAEWRDADVAPFAGERDGDGVGGSFDDDGDAAGVQMA